MAEEEAKSQGAESASPKSPAKAKKTKRKTAKRQTATRVRKRKNLVIVESPAKAKTINKILGNDFEVTSSMGHLVDLPKSRLGIDVEKNFDPHYIVIRDRLKFAKALKEDARGRETIYLAPDPDREGEAISWHLARLLQDDDIAEAKKALKSKKIELTEANQAALIQQSGRKIFRIAFHEITPNAIRSALDKRGAINMDKVNAQQARRILDRIVGYSLSPLLWAKVGRGLSAGRVQSVALRLIVDREREIEAFVPVEYWTIESLLEKLDGTARIKAKLSKIDGKKADLGNQEQAEAVVTELKAGEFMVNSVDQREQKRNPKPPFTTSTLQQEAYHKLGFSSAQTMRIAQQLYEGIELGDGNPTGLITYMRTDSVRLANDAISALREYIPNTFGKDYLPAKPRSYKSKKSAQEAHEAIRPTDVTLAPDEVKEYLDKKQFALYQMIWQRAVASQMTEAVDKIVTALIGAGKYELRASGRANIFPGWTKVYQLGEDDRPKSDGNDDEDDEVTPEETLLMLAKGDVMKMVECTPSQHFTKPPGRYTDASLVKTLEEQGVGRPSTYAPTIQTIVSRDYVRRNGGSLVPTDLGRTVTDLLVEHFPEILDTQFTADMEGDLDHIEDGDKDWVQVVRSFYTPFASRVKEAEDKMQEVKREAIPTEHKCEKCGKTMVIKWGRYGRFLSCSDYPECKTAGPVPTGAKCGEENCEGDLVERRSRGRVFYGCSNYPKCRYTTRKLPKDQVEEGQGDSSMPKTDEKDSSVSDSTAS